MKFEILYLIGKIRGKFLKEDWKFDVYCGITEKSKIKEIYEKSGWVPHRIEKSGTGFVKTG